MRRRNLSSGKNQLAAALYIAAAGVLFASCARDTTGYTGPFESEVRRAIPKLEESIGLTFKTPPRLELRERDDVREFLERQFNEQLTPLELAGTQAAYRRFGLLPDTLDLRSFLLDLLTEQVAGYYDPATKVLYVVRDAPKDVTSIIISHELVHALQDQYTPLDAALALKGDNDRQVAMQAVMEGQAVYEQMSAMFGGDMGLRMPNGWDDVREAIRSGQASMPLFARAPEIIQETLLFPYLSGAEFARQFKRARPGQAPFSPVAASTEQILHPEKYLSDAPDLPTRITLPAPRGATLVHEDNLGEFEVRLLLNQHLGDAGTASRAAAGWDGDRYQLVNTPRGEGIAWFTLWDSAVDAAEFRDTMQRALERRFKIRQAPSGTTELRTWTAADRFITLATAMVNGRPVVIYEDMPQGFSTRVIDASRVALQEP